MNEKSGTFTVRSRFKEIDAEAIAKKFKQLQNQMRKKIQGNQAEKIQRITYEIIERKPLSDKTKEILTVRWQIEEIC